MPNGSFFFFVLALAESLGRVEGFCFKGSLDGRGGRFVLGDGRAEGVLRIGKATTVVVSASSVTRTRCVMSMLIDLAGEDGGKRVYDSKLQLDQRS